MSVEKTIIVAQVTEKKAKNDRPYREVTDTQGNIHFFFEEDTFHFAKVGACLKLTKEPKGKYENVIGVEIGETKDAPIQSEASDDTKNQSIKAQVSAYIVADLWKAEKLPSDSPEVDALRSWLNANLGSSPKTTQKSDTPAQKTEQKATKKEEPKDVPEDEFLGPDPVNSITQEQLEALGIYQTNGIHLYSLIDKAWNIESARDLTKDQAQRLLTQCEAIMRAKEPGLPTEAKAAAKRD